MSVIIHVIYFIVKCSRKGDSKFTEKSKVICLALSLSRRPLNVLHDPSFYASLPILTGKKCYFCGFNHIVILEIV